MSELKTVSSEDLRSIKVSLSKRQLHVLKSMSEEDAMFYSFLTDIIENKKNEEQHNFLIVYPYFRSTVDIVEVWIDLYLASCREVEKKRKNNKEDLSPQSNSKQIKKDNIINFLMTGLKHNLLNIHREQQVKILNYMTKYKQGIGIINSVKKYFQIEQSADQQVKQIEPQVEPQVELIGKISTQKEKTEFQKKIAKFESILILNPDETSDPDLCESTDLSASTDNNKKREHKRFLDQNVEMVAKELTRVCASNIKNTHVHEFIWAAFDKKDDSKCMHVDKLIRAFNKISYWVTTEILTIPVVKDQLKCVDMFIELGQQLLKLKNYHMTHAVIAGLNNVSITRLRYLWGDRKSIKQLKLLEQLFDPKGGFSNYRKSVSSKDDAIIPYIGIIISDVKRILECPLYAERYQINMHVFNPLVELSTVNQSYIRNAKNMYKTITKSEELLKYLKSSIIVWEDNDRLYHYSIEMNSDGSKPKQKSRKMSTKRSSFQLTRSRSLKRSKSTDSADNDSNDSNSPRSDSPRLDKPLDKPRPPPNRPPPSKPSPNRTMSSMNLVHSSSEPLWLRKRNNSYSGSTDKLKTEPDYPLTKTTSLPNSNLRNKVNVVEYPIPDENSLDTIHLTNYQKWSKEDVSGWLKSIGLEMYIDAFLREEIMGELLEDINEKEMINDLGMSVLGHRIKLRREIKKLKTMRSML